jgi:hypothetical protein
MTGQGFGASIHYRKSYEVVGWTYNGALYCVDHKPEPPAEAVIVISATGAERGLLDGNNITLIDEPQPVFLDQVTAHDVCDLCLIPLDA